MLSDARRMSGTIFIYVGVQKPLFRIRVDVPAPLPESYTDLWKWSTECLNDFWMRIWSFTHVAASQEPDSAITTTDSRTLIPVPKWVPKARLNFTQKHSRTQICTTGA